MLIFCGISNIRSPSMMPTVRVIATFPTHYTTSMKTKENCIWNARPWYSGFYIKYWPLGSCTQTQDQNFPFIHTENFILSHKALTVLHLCTTPIFIVLYNMFSWLAFFLVFMFCYLLRSESPWFHFVIFALWSHFSFTYCPFLLEVMFCSVFLSIISNLRLV